MEATYGGPDTGGSLDLIPSVEEGPVLPPPPPSEWRVAIYKAHWHLVRPPPHCLFPLRRPSGVERCDCPMALDGAGAGECSRVTPAQWLTRCTCDGWQGQMVDVSLERMDLVAQGLTPKIYAPDGWFQVRLSCPSPSPCLPRSSLKSRTAPDYVVASGVGVGT